MYAEEWPCRHDLLRLSPGRAIGTSIPKETHRAQRGCVSEDVIPPSGTKRAQRRWLVNLYSSTNSQPPVNHPPSVPSNRNNAGWWTQISTSQPRPVVPRQTLLVESNRRPCPAPLPWPAVPLTTWICEDCPGLEILLGSPHVTPPLPKLSHLDLHLHLHALEKL